MDQKIPSGYYGRDKTHKNLHLLQASYAGIIQIRYQGSEHIPSQPDSTPAPLFIVGTSILRLILKVNRYCCSCHAHISDIPECPVTRLGGGAVQNRVYNGVKVTGKILLQKLLPPARHLNRIIAEHAASVGAQYQVSAAPGGKDGKGQLHAALHGLLC